MTRVDDIILFIYNLEKTHSINVLHDKLSTLYTLNLTYEPETSSLNKSFKLIDIVHLNFTVT